jgi:flagellar hook assembly protein FlgD
VINIKGNVINTLINSSLDAGYYGLTWNGEDQTGKPVPSGVYFYRLKTKDFHQTKKMLLLK